MNIMKIIGCILIILSTTGMGFYFSSIMKCRMEDLKEWKKLICLLRGDIRYASTPLPEAISSAGRRHEGNFHAFLNTVGTQLQELAGETLAAIWKSAAEKELSNTSLNTKDKVQLIRFGENLGYLDKDTQMNTFELYLSQLDEEIADLSRTVKGKAYLYNSLGIMAGIFITIIMI
jgi:stage III sporulation protein AB